MGRNISEPIGNFFRNLFNPFPEINSNSSRESSGSVVNVESLGYIDDNGEFHYWNNYDGPRLDVKTIGGDPFSGSGANNDARNSKDRRANIRRKYI